MSGQVGKIAWQASRRRPPIRKRERERDEKRPSWKFPREILGSGLFVITRRVVARVVTFLIPRDGKKKKRTARNTRFGKTTPENEVYL